jgi:two-component system, sensor histidine kinase and response regulator
VTTILVIEDESAILENVCEILQLEGFDTLGATGGCDGVRLAVEHRPDLVICDIMMTPMDGYQVLMALRENAATTTIPFVFLTARAERRDQRYGMTLGADDYLTKPFTPEELLMTIEARLERQAEVERIYRRELVELRDNLFSMLPHEFRTPLVTILGYAEMLSLEGGRMPGQHVVEMAGSILASGQRLHRLIENFLFYTQLEIIEQDPDQLAWLRQQRVKQPAALIERLAARQASVARREGDLVLDVDGPAHVYVAEDSLRKLVEELVDNAFKFSKPGQPVRVIALAEGGSFTLSVQDSGRGMTPDQVARIGAGVQFDRRRYEQQGAGLGLALVERLAALHEGQMMIRSTPGTGTTVEVTLPTS